MKKNNDRTEENKTKQKTATKKLYKTPRVNKLNNLGDDSKE